MPTSSAGWTVTGSPTPGAWQTAAPQAFAVRKASGTDPPATTSGLR